MDILYDDQIILHSLYKVKNKTITLFSINQKIKNFIINCSIRFKNINLKNPLSFWKSDFDDKDILILINFTKTPTGNWLYNRYIYSFIFF